MMDCFLISGQAFLDMIAYMNAVDTEICGIGKVEKDQAGVAFLSEVRILRQEVTGTTVNVEEEPLNEFFQDMEQKEREKWCFNWHTHPTFPTTPSGTDTTNYSKMQDMFDTFIPFILNRDLEFYLGLYTSYPWKTQTELKKIWPQHLKKLWRRKPYDIQEKLQGQQFKHLLDVSGLRMTGERQDFIMEEVKAKVIKPAPMVFTGAGEYQNNWQRQNTPITTPQNQIIRVGAGHTSDSAGSVGTTSRTVNANLDRHPHLKNSADDIKDEDWRKAIPEKNPHHMKRQDLIWYGEYWNYIFNYKVGQFESYDKEGNLTDTKTMEEFKKDLFDVWKQYKDLDDAHYEELAKQAEARELQAEIEENRSLQRHFMY